MLRQSKDSWAIRYPVVKTRNWWLGHDLLVAPQCIKHVNWAEQTVALNLTRDVPKPAPRYDPALPPTREAIAVDEHHGRAGYGLGAAQAA
jgi:hypothetical protein